MAGVDILASAFNGANAAFLGEQYARWAANPASVDPSFADLFGAMNEEARSVLEEASGASWAPHETFAEDGAQPAAPRRAAPSAVPSNEQVRAATWRRGSIRWACRSPRLTPNSIRVPTGSATPTWTGRSSSTTCWVGRP